MRSLTIMSLLFANADACRDAFFQGLEVADQGLQCYSIVA